MKKQLRKGELDELSKEIQRVFGVAQCFAGKKVELDEHVIIADGEQVFIKKNGLLLPTLRSLHKNCFLKKVSVDKGAIPFVCKGADVMRPGIVTFDAGIQKDELVAVVDAVHQKPLAVGKMMMGAQDAQVLDKGKVIENLHFVGDTYWKGEAT